MIVSPYIFKSKALRALKGNWQTALLVSFFATLPMTAVQLFQATQLPSVAALGDPAALRAAVAAVPAATWTLLGVLSALSLVLTPVLTLGCNVYFIRRLQGEELGFRGLFSRMGGFGKALLLYLLIYVKTFLWALLLIVPGLMAALRYSLAPYYLAQDPTLRVTEALQKSKDAMRDKKTNLFLLEASFLIWLLGAMLTETLLAGVSVILGMVASQFIQLMMAAYLNASVAGFFLAAAAPDGIASAQREAADWLRTMGGSFPGAMRHFGSDDNAGDESAGDGAGDLNGDANEPGDIPAPDDTDKPDQSGERDGAGEPDNAGEPGATRPPQAPQE